VPKEDDGVVRAPFIEKSVGTSAIPTIPTKNPQKLPSFGRNGAIFENEMFELEAKEESVIAIPNKEVWCRTSFPWHRSAPKYMLVGLLKHVIIHYYTSPIRRRVIEEQ